MPARKSKPSTKKPARGKKAGAPKSATGRTVTTIAVICVVVGGIAIAARQQQARPKEMPSAMNADLAPTATPVPSKVSARPVSPAVSNAPAAPGAVHTTTMASRNATTITGCLEHAGDGYRLRDAAGADVPRSRSWKSGFLKKASASIDVVDATHELALDQQVGRRVKITGPLEGREMNAQSVGRLSGSCKAS